MTFASGPAEIQRAILLAQAGVDVLVIDSAHADSRPVHEAFREVRKACPWVDIVVGNISEYDAAKRLVELGVDGIKVGQGGGSICTTRIVAGIGTPQVSAVYNCRKAVREAGATIPICADGGIRYPGDIPIALAAGGHTVMLGLALAGTDESPGTKLTLADGSVVKEYRGMGSAAAMEASDACRSRYGEIQTTKNRILAEGVAGYVPYAGSLSDTVHRLTEALRRGLGYTGFGSISELQQKALLQRLTHSGIVESHPHDITRL